MRNKALVIMCSLLFLPNLAFSEQNIIIDKKKNSEILFYKNDISIGGITIDKLTITSNDNEFYVLKGIGLKNRLSDKSYNFVSEMKKKDGFIDVKRLRMKPVGKRSEIIFSGKIKEHDLKKNKSIFSLLSKTEQFNLSLGGKSDASILMDFFDIKMLKEYIGIEYSEKLEIEKKDNYLSINLMKFELKGVLSFSFNGTIEILSNDFIIKNGSIEYSINSNSYIGKDIMSHFSLKKSNIKKELNNESLKKIIKNL